MKAMKKKEQSAQPKKSAKKETSARITAATVAAGEELERKAAVRGIVLTVNDDELAAWLVEKKYRITRAEAESLIKEIRVEITASAAGNRREKLGETLARLNEIYKVAIKTMDSKTALAVAKELSKTQRLYNTYEDKEAAEIDVEKETARQILESVVNGGGGMTLDELAKAAAYRLIAAETRDHAKLRGTAPRARKGAKAKSTDDGK